MQKIRTYQGFTLMELLIAIVIVGILTSVALPSYRKYLQKARYSELVQAASPYKLSVEECYQNMGSLEQCSAGQSGVLPAVTANTAKASINVASGVITVTPNNTRSSFANTDTYILTPTVNEFDGLSWSSSGGAVKAGLAN